MEPRRPLRPPWDRGKVPRRPRGQLRKRGRDLGSLATPGHAGGVMASTDSERSCLERALPALGADRRPPRARSPWCAGEPARNWGLASWEGRPPKVSSASTAFCAFTLCELWRLRASQCARRKAVLTLPERISRSRSGDPSPGRIGAAGADENSVSIAGRTKGRSPVRSDGNPATDKGWPGAEEGIDAAACHALCATDARMRRSLERALALPTVQEAWRVEGWGRTHGNGMATARRVH